MKEDLVINFSAKRKVLLWTIIIGFCLAGVTILNEAVKKGSPVLWVVGVVTLLYFLGVFITLLVKVLFRKVALRIDKDGIVDQSSLFATGRILWSDMVGIGHIDGGSVAYVVIFVEDPEAVIKNCRNFFVRFHLWVNYRYYRTPIMIPMIFLNAYLDDLELLLSKRLEVYWESNGIGVNGPNQ